MKNISILLFFLFGFIRGNAQPGMITTVAGNTTPIFTCPTVTANALYQPIFLNEDNDIIADRQGNLYFSLCAGIFKLDTNGIMSMFAGNNIQGYSGDGGPATAASLFDPKGLAFDKYGNMLFCEYTIGRVRKIDTAGIITTIGGNGLAGFSNGNGGPATNAIIQFPLGVACDTSGNIYVTTESSVKKIDTAGIITLYAGNDSVGNYSYGDEIPATDATFNVPFGIATDKRGNLYVGEYWGNVIRRIDNSGVIHLVINAGGSCADSIAAVSSFVPGVNRIKVDSVGNIYYVERGLDIRGIRRIDTSGMISTILNLPGYTCSNRRPQIIPEIGYPISFCLSNGNIFITEQRFIRKLSFVPYCSTDSFYVFIDPQCSGPIISIAANTHLYSMGIKTYYGDGQIDSLPFFTRAKYLYSYGWPHSYTTPGIYTVKHVFYNATGAADSISYSYNFGNCKEINNRLFNDYNGNGIFDSLETHSSIPLMVQVDSNGVNIDSFYLTSGLNYQAKGDSGDVYSFRLTHLPSGMVITAPSSGIVYDTLNTLPYELATNYFGLQCIAGTAFDLGVYASATTGRHVENIRIVANNAECLPADAILTLQYSPRYNFQFSAPWPSTVSGNMLTWNLSTLNVASGTNIIPVFLMTPDTALLMPGDTVHIDVSISPTTGDIDTSNNHILIIDTVKSSFDPNDMAVIPDGYIPSGITLNYAIQFENTGNAPAVNIHVMDTLSSNVDISTFRLISASHTMNVSYIYDSVRNIIRFDFPNINLPDTSHHGLCDGVVMFSIKTKGSLSDGTLIKNWAGIFFDDNPVVTTDTVTNIIGIAPVNSISTIDSKPAVIYPNPADKFIIIENATDKYEEYQLCNMDGNIVVSNKLSGKKNTIDIEHLPVGCYYIKLMGISGTKIEKFIKE